MSEINTPASIENADDDSNNDPIKQLKGELHRKTDKLGSQVEQLTRANAQMTAALERLLAPPAPKKPIEQDDFSTLIYSDPTKAMNMVKEQAKSEFREEMNISNQANQRVQGVIQSLVREYPELADEHSPMTKKSVEILNTLPEHERASPTAYRYAVKAAAEALEVKTMAKREPEDFADYNGGGSSVRNARHANRSDKKILSDIGPIAEALGVDMSDPERQKRIVERAKRPTWGEPISPFTTKKKGRN